MKSWDDVLKENTVTKTVEEVDTEEMGVNFLKCACDIHCMYKDMHNALVEDYKQLDTMIDNITEELTLEDLQKYMFILDSKLFEMERVLLGQLLKIYDYRHIYDSIGINHGIYKSEDSLNYGRKKVIENLKQYVEVD